MRASEIIERTEKGVKESNKVLIQELMQDLEQKGIQPVVSIDGEVKNLKLLEENESQNFNQVIANQNLEKSDFCALKADEKAQANCNPCNAIMVVCKSSGKTKKYLSNSKNWVDEFAQDLKNNFFLK